jgi:activating signal cointegrator 1
MRALSLTQIWASLCIWTDRDGIAEKQFETRGWKPSKQMLSEIGDQPIAIHAAKGFSKKAEMKAAENIAFLAALERHDIDFRSIKTSLPFGAIIGTVELYRFVKTEEVRSLLEPKELAFGDYSDGRWAWQFLNPKALKTPIPCKGALSLWEVPAEIEVQILEMINQ